MWDYISLSIETHLFFARIMKEHALFLEAGFPCCEKELLEEAGCFRQKFEDLLGDALGYAETAVHPAVINSGELATEFTIPAEKRTSALSGIPIDICLTETELNLRCSRMQGPQGPNCPLYQPAIQLNERALRLLHDFIRFQELILCRVKKAELFTANYPLLLEHIIREAKLYRDIIEQILSNQHVTYQSFYETEDFWNRIMMEHACFISGLLDPSETQLIETAESFSRDYARLLETACRRECRAGGATKMTLEETLKYRDFKAAGTKGILDYQIASIILPLLADHVLREANHYIRILESGRTR